MKKFTSFLAATAIVVVLASCGSKPAEETTATEPAVTETPMVDTSAAMVDTAAAMVADTTQK